MLLAVLATADVLADRLADKPIDYKEPSSKLPGTYEEIFTIEGRRRTNRSYAVSIDPNVWGYQPAFFERFGMPPKWIHQDIEGAPGLAWHYEKDALLRCGFEGDPERCRQASRCKLELFLDDRTWDLWRAELSISPELGRENPSRFLVPRTEADRAHRSHLEEEQAHAVGWLTAEYGEGSTSRSVDLEVREYRRELYEGIAYTSVQAPCTLPEQVPENKSLHIAFRDGQDRLRHTITLPPAYLDRVRVYQADKPSEVKAGRSEGRGGNYADWYTQAGWEARGKTGTFVQDPNIWVYTPEFARRFGMPERWIDESLEGAEALAYRVQWQTQLTCGYFGDPESCHKSFDNLLTIYVSENVSIPWAGHYPANSMFLRERARSYLRPQDPVEEARRSTFFSAFSGLMTESSLGRVQDTRVNERGIWPFETVEYKMKSSNLVPRHYRRDVYAGVDVFAVEGMFEGLRRSDELEIWIMTPLLAERTEVYHKIKVPDSFKERMTFYAESVKGIDSLWEEIKRRMELDTRE